MELKENLLRYTFNLLRLRFPESIQWNWKSCGAQVGVKSSPLNPFNGIESSLRAKGDAAVKLARIHSMELKVCFSPLPPIRLCLHRNPFNGIERIIKWYSQPEILIIYHVNPFNGIESSIGITLTEIQCHLWESIQWNWKMECYYHSSCLQMLGIHSMELKDCPASLSLPGKGSRWNPFNGIERYYSYGRRPANLPSWIHSMELKAVKVAWRFLRLGRPPESIQWNWK